MSKNLVREWVLAVVAEGDDFDDLPDAPHRFLTKSVEKFAQSAYEADVLTFASASEALEFGRLAQHVLNSYDRRKYSLICLHRKAHPIKGLLLCINELSELPLATIQHPAVSTALSQILRFVNALKRRSLGGVVPTIPPASEYVFTKSGHDVSKPPVFFTWDATFVEDPFNDRVVVWSTLEECDKYLEGVTSMNPELLNRVPIDRTQNLVYTLAKEISKLAPIAQRHTINPVLVDSIRLVRQAVHTEHIQDAIADGHNQLQG